MYYVLECFNITNDDGEALVKIQNHKTVGDVWTWISGEKLEPHEEKSIPSPIPMEVKFYRGYQGPPNEMRAVTTCVMSWRLADALTGAAGVDNIDYYPVLLRDEESGWEYDYLAFNIVGKVAAMDLEKSEVSTYDGRVDGTAGIHKLEIDESKTGGMLMFHLEENIGTIMVHESVKKHIEDAGIDTLTFIEPEEYVQL